MSFKVYWCLSLLLFFTGHAHAFVGDHDSELESGLLKSYGGDIEKKVLRVESEEKTLFRESSYFDTMKVLRDRRTNEIRLLHGVFPDLKPIGSMRAKDFVDSALFYIDQHPEIFHLTSQDVEVFKPGLLITKDEQFIPFHVYRDGLLIKDAAIHFRFKFGKLMQVVNHSFSEAEPLGGMARSGLMNEAQNSVNAKMVRPEKVMYRVAENSKGYHLEKVETYSVISHNNLPYLLEIEVTTGKVYELSRKFYNYRGEAGAEIYDRWYDETLGYSTFSSIDVQTVNGDVRTDLLGVFEADANASVEFSSGLKGRYVSVRNMSGDPVSQSGVFDGNEWSLNVEKVGSDEPWVDTRVAQSMIYDKTSDMVEHAKDYINHPWFDRVLGANANHNRTCNAYWDGSTINFFKADSRCANTGLIADVIYHEWGHGLHDNVQGGIRDGALSEGFGDIMSMIMTHSSSLGIGFLLEGRQPVRDLTDSRRYPEDARGGVHSEGMIIGTTFWDLFLKLKETYGEETAGDMLSNYALKMIFTARTYLEVYDALLVIDSDGRDPAEGSPNYCLINEVFSDHGLAESDAACDLAAVESWKFNGSERTIFRPGFVGFLTLEARNSANSTLSGLRAEVSAEGEGVLAQDKVLEWGDIASGTSLETKNSVKVSIPEDAACGSDFQTSARLYADNKEVNSSKTWTIGVNHGQVKSFAATDLPLAIEDYQTITSSVNAFEDSWTTDTKVLKLKLNFKIQHTYLGDLTVNLTSPEGTVHQVYKGSGKGNGSVDFSKDLSSLFGGQNISGTWELSVRDGAGLDQGTLEEFSLVLTPALYSCD